MARALRLAPEVAPEPPPTRLSRYTARELRDWSRIVYPLLPGMSWRRVTSHRAKWRRSVQILGDDWVRLKGGIVKG